MILIYKFTKWLMLPLLGKKAFQKLFKLLYYISLDGLNYGKGSSIDTSGELFLLIYLNRKLSSRKGKITLFDVGANIGDYTKRLAETFQKYEVEIFSFEPSAKTFKLLKENIPADFIQAINLGLGAKEENLKIYHNSLGSNYASIYEREDSEETEDIIITTLDIFCNDRSIEKISFLKIDIEGNEYNCLLGAQNLLNHKRIDFIQFEFGVSSIYARTYFKDIFDLLNINGYYVYRLLKDGFQQIQNYHHSQEIFATTVYVASAAKI
ncbi:MAG: FkbM family methyltransferase [Cyclobacteriaceae bacterium]